jgi:TolA-binding protein
MQRMQRAALAAVFVIGVAAFAQAQVVTQTDIQRLQEDVTQAETDLSQLRSRDASRANQFQAELDELRDEVTYLRVKFRKERSVSRAEYLDVRDRIESLRGRAAGGTVGVSTPAPATSAPLARGEVEIPAGTEMDVRLSNVLNSGTAQVEDRFEATTLADLTVNGLTAVPEGSVVRGVVSAVEPATRTNRTARMTVSFDQVTVGGRVYPIRGTVSQALEGEGIRGETGRVGAGAGVGAILGGILGGFKGAMAGILIGGGGTIAATEGQELNLPQGSVLRMRLDSPVRMQPAR